MPISVETFLSREWPFMSENLDEGFLSFFPPSALSAPPGGGPTPQGWAGRLGGGGGTRGTPQK